MGIRNLNKFLKTFAPACKTTIPLTRLRGTRVAIDANNMLCSTMYTANKHTYDHQELKLNPYAHIDRGEADKEWYRQLLSTVQTYASYGITPIFVFDGKFCPGKAEERDKRRKERANVLRRTDELTEEIAAKPLLERTDEEITRLGNAKASSEVKVSLEQIETSKSLLRAVGVPVLTAMGDAEDLCVALSHAGHVSAVVSRDTDCYALGCSMTINGITKGSKGPNHTVDVTLYEKILEGLAMDRADFVDLCILSKCDYNRGVPNVGAVRAYKLMKECGGLEGAIAKYSGKYKFHDDEGMNMNLEFCRETIFSVKDVEDCLDPEHNRTLPNLNINKSALGVYAVKSYMRAHGVEEYVIRLSVAYNNILHSGSYGAEYILGKRIIPTNNRPSIEVCDKPVFQKAEELAKALGIAMGNGTQCSEGSARDPTASSRLGYNTVDVIRDMMAGMSPFSDACKTPEVTHFD